MERELELENFNQEQCNTDWLTRRGIQSDLWGCIYFNQFQTSLARSLSLSLLCIHLFILKGQGWGGGSVVTCYLFHRTWEFRLPTHGPITTLFPWRINLSKGDNYELLNSFWSYKAHSFPAAQPSWNLQALYSKTTEIPQQPFDRREPFNELLSASFLVP